MKSKSILLIAILSLCFSACYKQERNCTDFKTGKFEFSQEIDGQKETSTFERTEEFQIETFRGKTDTSSVRWINDCEFILNKIKPKNREEKKGIHIKILSSNEDGYTFEYSFVGNTTKQKGTATKIN